MDYEHTITFGEGEYQTTIGFNATSTINFYDSLGNQVATLDPAELKMLVASYNACIKGDHESRLRDIELENKRK